MNLLKIRASRVEHGYSTHDAAEALGISDDAYRRRERGDVKFTEREIPIIANLYSMSAKQVNDYFFDGKLPNG